MASKRASQFWRNCSVQSIASLSGAALRRQRCSRPTTRRRTSVARSSTRTCLVAAGKVIRRGEASSLRLRSPPESCRMIARRAGWASAWKTRSSRGELSKTMWFSKPNGLSMSSRSLRRDRRRRFSELARVEREVDACVEHEKDMCLPLQRFSTSEVVAAAYGACHALPGALVSRSWRGRLSCSG